MNKKPLILTGIIFLLLASYIPFVSATETVTASQSTILAVASGHPLNANHPAGVGVFSAQGETFQALVQGYLSSITIYLARYDPNSYNNLTGTINLNVYTSDGDANSEPVDLVAQSTDILYAGLLSKTEWTPFTFDFNMTYLLQLNQYYVFEVIMTDSTTMATSYYHIAQGGSVSGGYRVGYTSSDWQVPQATNDLSFFVYVDPTGVTPTPTPSPTPEAMPNWISDIIDAIIPIFTPLLVIFICGALGWRFAGAWGFFAGINLAIVLMYVVAPVYMPLWAIVTVVVIDVALLFGKVGFGNR